MGYLTVAALLPVSLLLAGCQEKVVEVVADQPPSAPRGVFSVTGDLEVTIWWLSNPEQEKVIAYDVYWNDAPTGLFEYVASVDANDFCDQGYLCYTDTDVQYRTTYFYAVLAVNAAGESDFSYEDVFDTPRPEGEGLVLFDYLGPNSGQSGYDFSELTGAAQANNDPGTDVYFGAPNGVPTLFADQGAGVDIQDYGYINLEAVDWAPDNAASGWAPSGRVEMVVGHSYVVRIINTQSQFNVAKVYCSSASAASVTLDWAYQLDEDNPELFRVGSVN